jgi:hypothetical protein
MDSLPVTSISAESAARQIVRAMRSGRAELVISPQAKLASTASALAPELTADLLILTEGFLPSGEGKKKLHTGLESRDATPEILTTLSDAASLRNNELEPGEALG